MIVREIKKHAYSTIVMGRRLAKDKNIFKGVTDRVLANVHDVALWVLVWQPKIYLIHTFAFQAKLLIILN